MGQVFFHLRGFQLGVSELYIFTQQTMYSASEYLNQNHAMRMLEFHEFVQCYNIQNKHDIEKLIIYAISYSKCNILYALFAESSGYFDSLYDTFQLNINSLYSTQCLSLIPTIKTMQSNDNKDDSSLFSAELIEDSKQMQFDKQIHVPQLSVVSHSMLRHLLHTNEHINEDLCGFFYDSCTDHNHSITVNIKVCYMSYFDHCMLLGHYNIGLEVLELGGWKSFLNGNFMIYMREMIVKQSMNNYISLDRITYDNTYINIVWNLYSMGADIDSIYHDRVLKGFAYLYDVINDGKEIFETRQVALSKIVQECTALNLDLCFMFVSFVPYINKRMIKKNSRQKGMILPNGYKLVID